MRAGGQCTGRRDEGVNMDGRRCGSVMRHSRPAPRSGNRAPDRNVLGMASRVPADGVGEREASRNGGLARGSGGGLQLQPVDRRAPSGGTAPYALRATQHQSIPPEAQFTWLPYALITADGVVVTQGAVPAIFPGPLLPNLQGAPISEAGYDRVVERARALGLLDGDGDFTPPEPMPGSLSGLIELRVDGSMRQITGDPNRTIECITTPCDPAPGTPEAFGTFWRELGDLRSLVGDELGSRRSVSPRGLCAADRRDAARRRRARAPGAAVAARDAPRRDRARRSAMPTCRAARRSKARTRPRSRLRSRRPTS